MYGCVLFDSLTPGTDLGIVFMHNEGYSSNCGHGIIAVVSTLYKTGFYKIENKPQISIEVPAGEKINEIK